MLENAAWIETGPWTASDDPGVARLRDRRVRKFAAESLEKRRTTIAKKGRKLAGLQPRPRHKLRIQAKKLRYACGFFAGLYGGRRARRLEAFRTAMEDLQDALGAAVDITAAETLTTRLAGDEASPELAYAAGLVGGERRAGGDKTLRAAKKAFRRFEEAKPFW
jgi:triphosphatase